MMLLLIVIVFYIYKYLSPNTKAANSYSCNYYVGRCYVDNVYGKNNNLDDCNIKCFNNRFKYYFNKLAGVCTRDFRGTYNTKQECEDQNRKNNLKYFCNHETGVCNIIQNTITEVGLDYDTCYKNCRPLYKAYECDTVNMKCNFVAKSDDKAKLTYESCWTYCMGKNINDLPKETMYGCSAIGACVPNPSGKFSSYEDCYNDATCKMNLVLYREKTNIRYTWDVSSKKCVKNVRGEFESWMECRAVRQGIGSGTIYACDKANKKCIEKTWNDYLMQVIVGGKTGCYSSDCMNMGQGTHVEYQMPDMSCDIDDTCLLNPEAPKSERNLIYLTKESCTKLCGAVEALPDGKPGITKQNSMCISNHWLDVGQDFCNNDSECGTRNNVCRNKKNLPNDNGYEYIMKTVCDSNGLPYSDIQHTCKCIHGTCTETSSLYPTLLSSMICGDGQCLGIENRAWLYWFMKKDSTGKYQLVTPEYNKYYCARDCK